MSPRIEHELARDWGVMRVQIVGEAEKASTVELRAFRRVDGRSYGITVRPEELDGVIEALQRCRCLTLGHPKHDAKAAADPVLTRGARRT